MNPYEKIHAQKKAERLVREHEKAQAEQAKHAEMAREIILALQFLQSINHTLVRNGELSRMIEQRVGVFDNKAKLYPVVDKICQNLGLRSISREPYIEFKIPDEMPVLGEGGKKVVKQAVYHPPVMEMPLDQDLDDLPELDEHGNEIVT